METAFRLSILALAIKGFLAIWSYSGFVAIIVTLLAAPVLPFIGFYALIF